MYVCLVIEKLRSLPGGSDGKESAWSADDPDSIPAWVRKIPWRRKWQPTPQYSCLANSVDGLQSMRLQRAEHDRATNTHLFFAFYTNTDISCILCNIKTQHFKGQNQGEITDISEIIKIY